MKIKYRTADNTFIEVETTEEIALLLEDSYRSEENAERNHRRRQKISLDALVGDELEMSTEETPESILLDTEATAESGSRYSQALSLLTEIQRNRFLMFASGLSTCEIARREGTSQRSVYESIEWSRKKLKKFYEDTL